MSTLQGETGAANGTVRVWHTWARKRKIVKVRKRGYWGQVEKCKGFISINIWINSWLIRKVKTSSVCSFSPLLWQSCPLLVKCGSTVSCPKARTAAKLCRCVKQTFVLGCMVRLHYCSNSLEAPRVGMFDLLLHASLPLFLLSGRPGRTRITATELLLFTNEKLFSCFCLVSMCLSAAASWCMMCFYHKLKNCKIV